MASVDEVLNVLGVSHLSVPMQILLTIGFFILGLGSLETGSLLPLPLQGCWGALGENRLTGRNICQGVTILNKNPVNEENMLWLCSGSSEWWQPMTWVGSLLVVGRMFLCAFTGLSNDVFGRRRTALVCLAAYFVFSFARSFSPSREVYVVGVVLEGAFAQGAALSMILFATESSTQKECVRSVSLVLLGHALGTGVAAPLINMYVVNTVYRQIARSLPSIIFVFFIYALPESVRWAVTKGQSQNLYSILKKSHRIKMDDAAQIKMSAVHREIKKVLQQFRCQGGMMKQSVLPLVVARPLWRVFTPAILVALLVGCGIQFRLSHDTVPFYSMEDRLVAFGITEFLSLQILGLVLARIPVRRVAVALCVLMAVAVVLTKVLALANVNSCASDVFFSCFGHMTATLLWVWLLVGVSKVSPTHSRGALLGLIIAFATLGHSATPSIHALLSSDLGWAEYYCALFFAGLLLVASLLALILPPTPHLLPDTLAQVAPHLYWTLDVEGPEVEPHENTRL